MTLTPKKQHTRTLVNTSSKKCHQDSEKNIVSGFSLFLSFAPARLERFVGSAGERERVADVHRFRPRL